MPRHVRIQYKNAWYHVMNRGAGGRYIFDESHNKESFLDLLQEVYIKYSIEIHSFCIMDNHYHLLLRTPKVNLSDAMKYLQGMFTRIYNKKLSTDGPIFRGRYKSILLESTTAIMQVCRYIHLNPFETNLEGGLKYKWSSYNYFMSQTDIPNWLYIDYILSTFNSDKSKDLFIEFHLDNNTEKIKNFYKEKEKINFSVLSDEVLF